MSPIDVIRRYVEHFNAGDVHGLAALYAVDAVNHQVVTEPVRGRDAIHAMLEHEFARAALDCIVENLFADGEWVTLEWRDSLGLRGCEVFQVRQSEIVLQRGYFDLHAYCRRQGFSPPSTHTDV